MAHGGQMKGKRLPAQPMTAAEAQALMDACSRRAPTGVRNRAMIALVWRSGLRIAEALALLPKDLNVAAGTVFVAEGKGRKARMVGMDAQAFDVVARWMDRRSALGFNGRQTVFCTLDGGPLAASYVRALLPRLARRAGIERRAHAHALRHSHASELAAEGVPINVISAQLGHSSSAVTARYLDHVAPQAVIDTMRARRW